LGFLYVLVPSAPTSNLGESLTVRITNFLSAIGYLFRTGTSLIGSFVFVQALTFERLIPIGSRNALSTRMKGAVMTEELSFEFLLCGEYERLLSECQQTLDHWNGRSERIRQAQLSGEEPGRELLRLQARFAKSYAVLQRHIERCERCQLAARMNQCVTDANARSLATVSH
jgi:predicted secreted protein